MTMDAASIARQLRKTSSRGDVRESAAGEPAPKRPRVIASLSSLRLNSTESARLAIWQERQNDGATQSDQLDGPQADLNLDAFARRHMHPGPRLTLPVGIINIRERTDPDERTRISNMSWQAVQQYLDRLEVELTEEELAIFCNCFLEPHGGSCPGADDHKKERTKESKAVFILKKCCFGGLKLSEFREAGAIISDLLLGFDAKKLFKMSENYVNLVHKYQAPDANGSNSCSQRISLSTVFTMFAYFPRGPARTLVCDITDLMFWHSAGYSDADTARALITTFEGIGWEKFDRIRSILDFVIAKRPTAGLLSALTKVVRTVYSADSEAAETWKDLTYDIHKTFIESHHLRNALYYAATTISYPLLEDNDRIEYLSHLSALFKTFGNLRLNKAKEDGLLGTPHLEKHFRALITYTWNTKPRIAVKSAKFLFSRYLDTFKYLENLPDSDTWIRRFLVGFEPPSTQSFVLSFHRHVFLQEFDFKIDAASSNECQIVIGKAFTTMHRPVAWHLFARQTQYIHIPEVAAYLKQFRGLLDLTYQFCRRPSTEPSTPGPRLPEGIVNGIKDTCGRHSIGRPCTLCPEIVEYLESADDGVFEKQVDEEIVRNGHLRRVRKTMQRCIESPSTPGPNAQAVCAMTIATVPEVYAPGEVTVLKIDKGNGKGFGYDMERFEKEIGEMKDAYAVLGVRVGADGEMMEE